MISSRSDMCIVLVYIAKESTAKGKGFFVAIFNFVNS